ncbi:uncharacterized protein LOC101755958 [Setaria italica]|uniref:uncharacterized protein LOC101755958 n=1 Tax=Setaria italica TaxID=4555 RepID=UPI000350DB6B|nr:uncharacterized protein LOC101755958 [Setaria italica]
MTSPPRLPPPRLRSSPPELDGDVIAEILLRLPPYKPELLIRCSSVCKSWRRLLTDPAFLRRYRVFHGAPPPMLGVLFNLDLHRNWRRIVARFVHRASSFRPRALEHDGCCVRDARHGRVLFRNPAYEENDLFVWNPITDERWELPLPVSVLSYAAWNVTVLCAAAVREGGGDCDHLDCHGGPFLVTFVGTDDDGVTCGRVYSSETAAWSDAAYAEHPDDLADMDTRPCALVGNRVYCLAAGSMTIVEYDLDRRKLAFIDPPSAYEGHGVLMPAMGGGGLGFAGVRGSCLYLWSREAGPDTTPAWTQSRALELNTLPGGTSLNEPTTVGFAEGLGVIFVRTDAGVFRIKLKSGRAKKMSSRSSIDAVIPYMSFYTPGDF